MFLQINNYLKSPLKDHKNANLYSSYIFHMLGANYNKQPISITFHGT